MLPYDCDSTLPIEERYSSPKFRRLSRHFEPAKLLWLEAAEVVAWTQFLGSPRDAKGIMQWSWDQVKRVEAMCAEPELIEAAAPLLHENHAQATLEDGFRIIHSIHDQGWRKWTMPPIVTQALREEYHRTGITAREQAAKYGMPKRLIDRLRAPNRSRVKGRGVFVV